MTLSGLNTAGTAPAAGAINFVDSTGFTVAAQPGNGLVGQEIGVNTASNATLSGRGDFSRLAAWLQNLPSAACSIPVQGYRCRRGNGGHFNHWFDSESRAKHHVGEQFGMGLYATGPITERAERPHLRARFEGSDQSQRWCIDHAHGAGNNVDAIALSTLNGPGNAIAGPAPGTISFADGNGIQIFYMYQTE